jgi:hypothetical protein
MDLFGAFRFLSDASILVRGMHFFLTWMEFYFSTRLTEVFLLHDLIVGAS